MNQFVPKELFGYDFVPKELFENYFVPKELFENGTVLHKNGTVRNEVKII